MATLEVAPRNISDRTPGLAEAVDRLLDEAQRMYGDSSKTYEALFGNSVGTPGFDERPYRRCQKAWAKFKEGYEKCQPSPTEAAFNELRDAHEELQATLSKLNEAYTQYEDDHKELDYQKIKHVPSPEPRETPLENIIDTESHNRLRKILKELVRTQPAAKAMIESQLTTSIPGSSKKRKQHEVCTKCDSEWRVGENVLGDCVHHPGELEPNYDHDCWADAWTEEERPTEEEYPECFNWTCCGRAGDEDGCIISRHVPEESAVKRTRN